LTFVQFDRPGNEQVCYNSIMYAEIAVNAPVNQTFHYHIPDELEGKLSPGHLLEVPFGTALQHGIVVGLHDESPVDQTKGVRALLDPQPVVTAAQIELAHWISERYLAPIGFCLWLMLPPGISGGRDIRVTLLQPDATSPDSVEQEILKLLGRKGSMTGRRLEVAKPLQGVQWRGAVDRLTKEGILAKERILTPPRVRPKTIATAALAIHPNHIPAVARQLGKESREANILEVLAAMRVEFPSVDQVLEAAEVTTKKPLEKLESAGLVTVNRTATPNKISLNIPRFKVDEKLLELRKGDKDLHVLKVLAREAGPMEVNWLYAQTNTKLDDLRRLEEEGLILLGEQQTWRDSLADRDFVPSVAPPLIPEQEAAWAVIKAALEAWVWETPIDPSQRLDPLPASPNSDEGANNLFLLHGVTGSGKTELYLRAIELTLAQGRQAIFLVPEIALTAQTVRRVAARFPGQVAIVHSRLSEGERYDTWRRARDGLIGVVVGARSALFTPLPDVGLVILDEEHDNSYKQSPPFPPPYYHTRDVAEAMTRLNNGVLILGSATPDLETVHRANQSDFTVLRLPTRIMGHRIRILEQSERAGIAARYYPTRAEDAVAIDLPPVKVVDMREELKNGNTSIFSRELQTALGDVLDRRQQAILFLNRRGSSTYVFCRDCGYVATCPRCDMPLTYHRHAEMLRCHQCGYQVPEPKVCPQCGSNRIKFFGAGTQQIEQALIAQFPGARTLRWDADTATNPETHDLFLSRFVDGKADILIGTQMVTKGLDLPLVTLVGVVSADLGLNLPDFRACETTFQILTQVAGRAGRGLLGGRVVLQTYQPDHYAIQAAAKHDFDGFYAQEIGYRRDLGYPPFRRLVRMVFRSENEARAQADAEEAASMLRRRLDKLKMTGTELIGPAPCFFSRVNQVYRWHLFLRGPDPVAALRGFEPGRGWYVDIDPVDVL
jgi:primosomal protein N' (replication factor Y) (superfamily II helicase)